MTHALIIGSGIAGTTTAMALQKAGITCTVYEAYPTGADDIGAFLMIMHNGLDALRAIDAHQPVIDNSFRTTKVEYLDAAGTVLAARPIGDQHTDQDGPRTLKRGELYRALQDELLRRGGIIEHGKRLVHATTTPAGRVVAGFADGTQAEGDLLIGADGVRSTTRTIIDPQAPAPRYTGQLSYGYTHDTTVPQAPDTFRMISGSRTGFGHTTSPTGETYWTAGLPGAETTELSRAEITAIPLEQWREGVLKLFADDTDTTAVQIVSASTEDLMVTNVYDIPTVGRWHNSHMVLVGDAAHAASPSAAQGASMALEDSVILAKCLRDLPDPEQAFSTYERTRRARVERLVAFSANQNQDSASQNQDSASQNQDRDEDRTSPQARAWLYEHHIDWHAPITQDVGEQEATRQPSR